MNGWAWLLNVSLLLAFAGQAPRFEDWTGTVITTSAGETIEAREDVVSGNLTRLTFYNSEGRVFVYYIERDSTSKVVFGDCRRIGEDELGIIALVVHDPEEEILRDVQIAWRYNSELKQLVSLNPKTVECLNESYGV